MKRRGINAVLAVLAVVACLRPSGVSAQTDTLPPLCFGDCEMSGTVDISDLVLLVNVALGSAPIAACAGILEPPGIDDLLRAVNTSLSHCPVSITYRLTDGSTIIVSDGFGLPAPTPQPLAGQFTVTVSTDLMPNTLMGLTIKRVSFTATGVAVTEGQLTSNPNCSYPQPELGYGCITANTINPPPVTYASASLSINGQFSELIGAGPFEGNRYPPPYDGSTPPPRFNHLTLCSAYPFCDDIRSGAAAGYVLTLFAAPDGYATLSPTPTPTAVVTYTATGTFVPPPSCTVSATRTPTDTPSVTPTPMPTRTCPAVPPPATCPAGQVIACADHLCSIDCGCGTVTSTPTPTNTCTPGANPPPGCAYEGGTPTWTVTPCNEDRSTPTSVRTLQSTPTCTPHSAPDFPPCKPGQSLVCADRQCLLNCSCVDDTPTPLPTPTGGPSLCRENADCNPSFQLCLEPGGFVGCGICYSDSAIDQHFRRCGRDEDCRDRAESDICQPLGHASRTCQPCSGGTVTVCLSGCSEDDECNVGQVCVAHRCTGRPCSDAQSCPPQHVCVQSPEGGMRCARQMCTSDADCSDGSCVRGFCHDNLGRCVLISRHKLEEPRGLQP